jgi:predicted nucleic acid-binding protein
MKTAIDTSALLAILKNERSSELWVACLAEARASGSLVICDVVYSELSAGFSEVELLDEALSKLGVEYEPMNRESAFLAGAIYRAYRDSKGPRERMIPDFLIGAHASRQADQLAAADRGYFQDYFEDLAVLTI